VAASGSEPDARKWCKTTLVRKPNRAKFDAPTGLLVARHDHYCIWLDTAVGHGNHRVFMVFVFFQVLSHYLFSIFGWTNVLSYLRQEDHSDFCAVVIALTAQRIWGLAALTLCSSLCALSLSFLLFQQVGNIAGNITTNERMNSSRYPWLLDDEGKRFVNRYDTGSMWANAKEFWTKSKDYRRTYSLPPVPKGRLGMACRDGCCEEMEMEPLSDGGGRGGGRGEHGHSHSHHEHENGNRV